MLVYKTLKVLFPIQLLLIILSLFFRNWIISIMVFVLTLLLLLLIKIQKDNIRNDFKQTLEETQKLLLKYHSYGKTTEMIIKDYFDNYLYEYYYKREMFKDYYKRTYVDLETELIMYHRTKSLLLKIRKKITHINSLLNFSTKIKNSSNFNFIRLILILIMNYIFVIDNNSLRKKIYLLENYKHYFEIRLKLVNEKKQRKNNQNNRNTNNNYSQKNTNQVNNDIKAKYLKSFGLTESTLNKENLKQQYRKLCKKYHPDNNKSNNAQQQFEEVQKRYEYLKQYV